MNGQKPLIFLISLWPKILDNWQHWHQKCKSKRAKEVIHYFPCKSGRDLTGNTCTRPSFRQTKRDPHRVFCTDLFTIPWAGLLSLFKFHSIDKQGSIQVGCVPAARPTYVLQKPPDVPEGYGPGSQGVSSQEGMSRGVRPYPPQTEWWQTPVKTLPSRSFVGGR